MNTPTMARVFRKEAFLRVANALHGTKPGQDDEDISPGMQTVHEVKYAQWMDDCEALAEMFAAQSQSFDREHFITNCKNGVT